jgi:hypothetical protein
VFLAGDAAHQYIPTGGYGMNTGIGDACAVAWQVAAVLQGWGGQALLDAYEAERRPVGLINRGWSERHTGVRMEIAGAYSANADAEIDAAQRQRLAAFFKQAGNVENEAWGIEFAYRYDGSPVIAPILEQERGSPPPDDPLSIPAAAWPGMRAPHLFDGGGAAIFDKLAVHGFTLLRFNQAADPGPMQAAAVASGVPLKVADIASDRAREIYGADLALVRPDQHLAWRGDRADPAALHIARGVLPA